ncbi:MAG: UDP-N-acetylmuramoyl-L-alanyl-D-glutamate--2,6-diaminopimelate ligase [Anaerolineales bacterium]|nr:MAG: UDP-N-acetylmuramoyl-L-alanyl-D-glutamate--2,6-diaminopimelate ligase [Anaerolineales bacterium]
MNAISYQTRLDNLYATLPSRLRADLSIYGTHESQVTGIVQDSQHVKPGNIFVARTGSTRDGHQYIHDAIKRGASVVIGEKSFTDLPVPYIQTSDASLALAYLAAAFYRFPARKLVLIGVTGTDGKTTTCHLIFNILKAADYRTGMITTVNAIIGKNVIDTGLHVTTPDAIDVQRYLAEMVEQNCTHAVLEVTSHGLDQHRVTGCDFDLAVITNITHEHLDYHGSYESYREAKSRLLSLMIEAGPKEFQLKPSAVLNRDDISYEFLSSFMESSTEKLQKTVNLITYGVNASADIRGKSIKLKADGLEFEASSLSKRIKIKSELLGQYNVSNIMAAVATTSLGLGVEPDAIEEGVALTRAIPGRMELVDMGQDFTAIVDFAHTPNALKSSLESARQMLEWKAERGRLIAIFGSAGLRDREKRRMMAEISVQIADVSIFTAEDPRTESLGDILEEMKMGAEAGKGVEYKSFWCIPDRREALRCGINMAKRGDVVIALGKGHEQSMCFGEAEYAWDDRIAMKATLAERLRVEGPQMPFLPDWD